MADLSPEARHKLYAEQINRQRPSQQQKITFADKLRNIYTLAIIGSIVLLVGMMLPWHQYLFLPIAGSDILLGKIILLFSLVSGALAVFGIVYQKDFRRAISICIGFIVPLFVLYFFIAEYPLEFGYWISCTGALIHLVRGVFSANSWRKN